MKHKILILPVLILAVLLAGCAASRDSAETSSGDRASAPPFAPLPSKQLQVGTESIAVPQGGGGQHMIRTASISLEVENLEDVLRRINAAVDRAGGYIMQSNVAGPGENRQANLTLRVPEAKFIALLDEVEELGKLINRSTDDTDVTLSYVDLEARIRNLDRQEERLLAILDKAETIEDILRVEQELWRIRGQLESLTAEFSHLRDRVQFASVYVELRETPTASNVISISGLGRLWQRGWDGFVRTVNTMIVGIGNSLVFLLTVLPYLVFVLIAAAVYVRNRKKAKKKIEQAPPEAGETG